MLPMHSAVRAAKEIATLDRLSGGRVTVAVGTGGREKDYQAVGASTAKRWQKMDEQIETMRSIWKGEPPFPGADPVGPGPLQSDGPPILSGAMGPKATRRAAEWADGVFSWSGGGNEGEIAHLFQLARDAWKDAKRDSEPYLLGGFFCCLQPENARQTLWQYVYDYLVTNQGEEIAQLLADGAGCHSAEAINQALDGYERAGCQEIQFSVVTAELDEVDRLGELVNKRIASSQ